MLDQAETENRSFIDRAKDVIRPLAIRCSSSAGLQGAALRVSYFGKFHNWVARNPSPVVADRLDLYDYVATQLIGERAIAYLEFGVYKGMTVRWWTTRSTNPESTFVGFDSFEGLPSDWGSMPAGTFSTNGAVPDIADRRVRFEKGWFSSTVPSFLAKYSTGDRVLVAHLDADLYSSTLLVLLHLAPHLVNGSILIFDEFADYVDEFRALEEAVQAHPFAYRVIAHTPSWTQVAIQVTVPSRGSPAGTLSPLAGPNDA